MDLLKTILFAFRHIRYLILGEGAQGPSYDRDKHSVLAPSANTAPEITPYFIGVSGATPQKPMKASNTEIAKTEIVAQLIVIAPINLNKLRVVYLHHFCKLVMSSASPTDIEMNEFPWKTNTMAGNNNDNDNGKNKVLRKRKAMAENISLATFLNTLLENFRLLSAPAATPADDQGKTAKHLFSSLYTLERASLERREQEHDVEEDGFEATLEKPCAVKECEKDQFQCRNERCIPAIWKCDEDDDCSDNSDEADCQCLSSAAMHKAVVNTVSCSGIEGDSAKLG
ncbi:hypothetical protein Q9233_001353 [Columba guinea]|nr:hypothetical protein Q9233_001353 [Columba guinea]